MRAPAANEDKTKEPRATPGGHWPGLDARVLGGTRERGQCGMPRACGLKLPEIPPLLPLPALELQHPERIGPLRLASTSVVDALWAQFSQRSRTTEAVSLSAMRKGLDL
jgi:hypothetical protein